MNNKVKRTFRTEAKDFNLFLPKTQARLNYILKTYNISHEKFAKIIGIDAPYISRFSRASFNAVPSRWLVDCVISGLFRRDCKEYREIKEELYTACKISGNKNCKLFDFGKTDKQIFLLGKIIKTSEVRTDVKELRAMKNLKTKTPKGTKVCTKCGRVNTLENFHVDNSKRDGLDCWCMACKLRYTLKTVRHENKLLKKQLNQPSNNVCFVSKEPEKVDFWERIKLWLWIATQ